jgi:hypothetical protein
MQQRRVRLGDVLDDYCPRERRITNHAVVAMIEDEVKQTRCTTCDAEHEYKHAKVPAPRRKKPVATAALVPAEATESPALMSGEETVEEMIDDTPVLPLPTLETAKEPEPEAAEAVEAADAADTEEQPAAEGAEDEWPVHRPLIRATLPRPEGQAPERRPPDFTIRQNGGRFDGQRNGNKSRGNRHGRHAQGQGQGQGQSRFGGSRQGSGYGSRQGGGNQQQRHGNRQGPSSGQRGGRPGQGGGNRPGQGRGPKRGR